MEIFGKIFTVNVPISQNWPFSQRVSGILKICEMGTLTVIFFQFSEIVGMLPKHNSKSNLKAEANSTSIQSFACHVTWKNPNYQFKLMNEYD